MRMNVISCFTEAQWSKNHDDDLQKYILIFPISSCVNSSAKPQVTGLLKWTELLGSLFSGLLHDLTTPVFLVQLPENWRGWRLTCSCYIVDFLCHIYVLHCHSFCVYHLVGESFLHLVMQIGRNCVLCLFHLRHQYFVFLASKSNLIWSNHINLFAKSIEFLSQIDPVFSAMGLYQDYMMFSCYDYSLLLVLKIL